VGTNGGVTAGGSVKVGLVVEVERLSITFGGGNELWVGNELQEQSKRVKIITNPKKLNKLLLVKEAPSY